jgi:hypothetical protein
MKSPLQLIGDFIGSTVALVGFAIFVLLVSTAFYGAFMAPFLGEWHFAAILVGSLCGLAAIGVIVETLDRRQK